MLCALGLIVASFASPELNQVQLKKLKTGTTIGELRSIGTAKNKRDLEIDVLAPGEEKARRYTIGGQQKDIITAVKAAKVGDRVEIAWFDTVEGLCVEKFQVLPRKQHQ